MKQLKKGPIERYKSIILKHVYTYKILSFSFTQIDFLRNACDSLTLKLTFTDTFL